MQSVFLSVEEEKYCRVEVSPLLMQRLLFTGDKCKVKLNISYNLYWPFRQDGSCFSGRDVCSLSLPHFKSVYGQRTAFTEDGV